MRETGAAALYAGQSACMQEKGSAHCGSELFHCWACIGCPVVTLRDT